MSIRWDLAVYDHQHQLALVVEVKSVRGVSSSWAAQLRRNILAHGSYLNAPFFLVALPDHFYLWKNSESLPEAVEPDYVIDARPILEPYFTQSMIESEQLSGATLELIVAAWLNSVIHRAPDELADYEQWVLDSGLYPVVAGGELEHMVLA